MLTFVIDFHSNLIDFLICFLDILTCFDDKDSNIVDIHSNVLDIHSCWVDIDSNEIDSHYCVVFMKKCHFGVYFSVAGLDCFVPRNDEKEVRNVGYGVGNNNLRFVL